MKFQQSPRYTEAPAPPKKSPPVRKKSYAGGERPPAQLPKPAIRKISVPSATGVETTMVVAVPPSKFYCFLPNSTNE